MVMILQMMTITMMVLVRKERERESVFLHLLLYTISLSGGFVTSVQGEEELDEPCNISSQDMRKEEEERDYRKTRTFFSLSLSSHHFFPSLVLSTLKLLLSIASHDKRCERIASVQYSSLSVHDSSKIL